MSKIRFIMGILLSLCLILLPIAPVAAEGVTISVLPAENVYLAGSDFWVTLNISQVTNLHMYQAEVTYDPGVIQIVGAEGGPGIAAGMVGGVSLPVTSWTFQPTPGVSSGTVKINGAFGSSTTVSGIGALVRLHFYILGSAGQNTDIIINNISLNDGFITVGTLVPGSLTVAFPPVVVTIDTPSSVSSGDTFRARLNISQVANLAAYQVVIQYNSSIIEVNGEEGISGVTAGLIGSTIMPVDSWGYYPAGTPGKMIVMGHIPGAGKVTDSGYLLDIEFRVIGAQGTSSNIVFTTVPTAYSKLFDSTGKKMDSVTWTGTSVNITSAYRITNTSLPNGEIEIGYSQTLGATGGQAPYSYSIASGSLPSGLTLSPSGLISGTPTQVGGPITITFRVTDSTLTSATRSLSITIVGHPAITTTSPLPLGTAKAYYTKTLAASGGQLPYTWSVTSGSLPPGLSLSTAGKLSGTPDTAGGPYVFTVTVVDSFGGSGSASLSITILSGPVIISGPTLPSGEKNVYYTQNLAVTGGTTPYSFSMISGTLPTGLTLSTTGTISGTPTFAGGPSRFTVQVSDAGGAFSNTELSITIADNPVITTTSPLPTGEVNLAYSKTLELSGGLPPFNWVKTSGTYPAGISLSPAGLLSGTPTATANSTSLTFMVTDSAGKSNSKTFSITILAAPSISTATTLTSAQIGLFYSQQLAATGGQTPYTWTLTGTLPTGLSLSSTGLISGTPTVLGGPVSFGVRLRDNLGGIVDRVFSINIVSGPVITTNSTLPSGEVSIAYSQTLTVDGGIGPYTWSKINGTWPTGLSMTTAGVISGTPTTAGGPTTITIRVVDSNGSFTVKDLAITIVAKVTIATTGTLTSGEAGIYYSKALGVNGGVGPFTWSKTGGSWPSGLSLSTDGVISGTPTTVGGPTTANIKVVDSLGAEATGSVSISIAAAPVINSASPLASGETTAPYAITLVATGGVKPYNWQIISGSLPAGLSLVPSTGVISGTPTTSGSYSFTVQLTDALNVQITKNFILNIITGPYFAVSSPLRNAEINKLYSLSLFVYGGVSPYTWTKVSGTLPSGISLTSAGVLYGTPKTAGGPYSITVRATDSAGGSVTSTFEFSVAPVPSVATTSPLPNGEVSLPYSYPLAVTGGVGPYTWTKSSGTWPAGLSLSADGVISGIPTTAGGPTSVTVVVTDYYNKTASASLSITIVTAPSITTASPLPSGEVTAPYSRQLASSGGVTPFTFQILSGSLPPGLTLSSGGLISGTPTLSGSFNFTIRLLDSMGGITSKDFTLVIAASPTITTATMLSTGEVSVPYSKALTVTGGVAPYAWSITSGTLPTGMSLTAAGVITGTPNVAVASTTVTINVVDSLGGHDSEVFTITIVAAPTISNNATLPSGEVTVPYYQALAVSGGTGTFTWSLQAGTLPGGLSVNSGGFISGTPTGSGSFSFTIKVVDSYGVTGSKVFSLIIISAPSISTASLLSNGEVEIAYSISLSATGGTAPYTWSASGLPPGLNITTEGIISGTPSTTGNYNINVTIVDSFSTSATASKILTLNIFETVKIESNLLVEAVRGRVYNQTLAASGGNSLYTWSATGLPQGLTLSANGVLSGTPATEGEFEVNIGLTDTIRGANPVMKTLTLKVFLPYDANGNGVVDMGDVVKVERIILLYDISTAAADANFNGIVDASDIIRIERYILGIE